MLPEGDRGKVVSRQQRSRWLWRREVWGKVWGFGKEVGENGTPHLQGYMECGSKKIMKGLKKISSRAHWEVIYKERTKAYGQWIQSCS